MQIMQDRRNLHRSPELDRDLPKTLEYLKESLKGLSCRVFSPMDGALCAYFDFGRESTIAFRSDADALPIMERSRIDFASEHPGKMHACGHDAHIVNGLGAAKLLKDHLDQWQGKVKLLKNNQTRESDTNFER